MIIVFLIIVIISLFLYRSSKRNEDEKPSYWKELFSVVALRVVDYYYKGTPTKVVILALRILGVGFEVTSIVCPIINAAISYDETTGFWKLLLTFQWDSFSSIMSYCYIAAIVLIVVVYLVFNGKDSNLEGVFHDLNKRLDSIETTVSQIHSDVRDNGAKLDDLKTSVEALSAELKTNGSSTIKHILPELEKSISSLKIRSTFTLLKTILKEVEIGFENDLVLRARIYFMLGECAKYIKGEDSNEFHYKAYQLIKSHAIDMPYVIIGMIYELCRKKSYIDAQKYADELIQVNSDNFWCFIPRLLNASNLRDEIDKLPDSIDKQYVLAYVLMLGGCKTGDIGVDIDTYEYNHLNLITTENFPLWLMDLSVAMTRFCQNFTFNRNVKSMYNQYAKDLFEKSDQYLNLLKTTDIDNILPDTVFIHALTGYLNDQNSRWIDDLANAKPNEEMKEIYYLGYAYILNDAKNYNEAKELLKKYEGPELASIINLRFMLAFMNNDMQECVNVFIFAAEKQVVFPDHLTNYLFSTVQVLYDSVKEYIVKIQFINDLSHRVFVEFSKNCLDEEVDVEFLLRQKTNYPQYILPFVAIIAKKQNKLEFAIELLESCVDKKILDIRSALLIDYYRENLNCRQKLYHLLGDLRSAGNLDINNLSLELQLSMEVLDYDRSLQITTEMMNLNPNNDCVLINHIQALYRHSNHESEIISYENRLIELTLQADYVMVLFDIYHTIGETEFALEFLYQQIIRTQDQTLKDFWINRHMNPEVDRFVSPEKEIIEIGDFISINMNNENKDVIVSSGSVYEDLCGHRKKDRLKLRNGLDEIEILAIHTKYYKFTKDVYEEVQKSASSKSIKMFNLDDYGFNEDPLGALRKMIGKTDEDRQKEQARLMQYRNGETPLSCFVSSCDLFIGFYEKIFGNFMVCGVPNEAYNNIIPEDYDICKAEVVLDISSLISIHEYDMRYGLSCDKKFILPKSIMFALKQDIINEEKGLPKVFSRNLIEKLTIKNIDESKTGLWNKLKNLETWVSERCTIKTVEESMNIKPEIRQEVTSRITLDCLLLAGQSRLLLTEDWFYTRKFIKTLPIMSVFNWLSLTRRDKAEDWGQLMLECGNVGYPMSAEYIREQYDLCSRSSTNNYHTCLENMKYHLPSAEEVIKAANSLFIGVVTPSNIAGATNMLTILFSGMDDNLCKLLIQRELLSSKDKEWCQCFIDAMRVSHPQLLAY